MDVSDVAVAILAAGQGRRFGSDKLLVPIDAVPMGLHIARTLASFYFTARFAVCASGTPLSRDFDAMGFQTLWNEAPELGQASSLQIAVHAAENTAAKGLLIVLADMPFVTAEHILSVISVGGFAASHDGTAAMPPVLFPRAVWPLLTATQGDRGARLLLSDAQLVPASPSELRDIDVADDLPTPRQS